MLDELKSKFGFATNGNGGPKHLRRETYTQNYDAYDSYDSAYQDEYGEYDTCESNPYTLNDRNDGGYGQPAPITTRAANDTVARLNARTSASAKLVSFSDVRERMHVPESLKRNPLPPRHVSSPSKNIRAQRTSVSMYNDDVLADDSADNAFADSGFQDDATQNPSPSVGLSASADALASASATSVLPSVGLKKPASKLASTRSAGLNSLFEPSEENDVNQGVAGSAAVAAGAPIASLSSAGANTTSGAGASSLSGKTSAFDPYDAYTGTGATTSFSSSRSCKVLKPVSYAEVERVAKILKAGDVVVLVLRNTPDTLSKRILDFSFGVSAALDANVECIASKVFAIVRGQALTSTERDNLHSQGVL